MEVIANEGKYSYLAITFTFHMYSNPIRRKINTSYLPLDHKKGGKGAESKPSSTQGGSGGEYSVLGNSKVRKNPTNDNAIV